MSTYKEITDKLTDQVVEAIEQATKNIPTGIDFSKANLEFPDITKLLPGGQLPSALDAREVVETNYRVAERLLAAQRDFTLAVIEKSSPKAPDSE